MPIPTCYVSLSFQTMWSGPRKSGSVVRELDPPGIDLSIALQSTDVMATRLRLLVLSTSCPEECSS